MTLTHVLQYQWLDSNLLGKLIKDNSSPNNSPSQGMSHRHTLAPSLKPRFQQIPLNSNLNKQPNLGSHLSSVKLMEQAQEEGTKRDMVSTRSLA